MTRPVPVTLLLATAFLAFAASPATAGLLRVTSTKDDVAQKGSLRAVLGRAEPGDVIRFEVAGPVVLESALNDPAMPPDRLSAAGASVDVIPVSGDVTFEDPQNTVRFVSIGPGPHASAALGVHAADGGYFFVSDLHVPNSDDDVPRADRVVTECWFARWAVANLPPATVVLNSHGTPETPVTRLRKYLESEHCQALGG